MRNALKNWERFLFAIVGGVFLVASFNFLFRENLPFFSTTFGVSFFCFFYSNLARFKRFKGLGFEAELWEDKQKEAADLIERLKSVVSVYTREIMTNRVMMGRLGGGAKWQSHWNLFDELVSRHVELGQQIDFAPLKAQLDSVFLFDIANHLQRDMLAPVRDAKSRARQMISAEFGSPIEDAAGYRKRIEQLNQVPDGLDKLFERSKTENLARKIIDSAMVAAERLKADFGIEVIYDQAILDNLMLAADAADRRPLAVTPKLIALADRESD